ncbi:zinc ribbon domain-containing protein [Ktedonospora formicarum]|uniref:zinc ribbon domain-containing protein n=1 Tax=Ktedonospora formicarum TaxID=2778364 RepID=UPI001C68C584
MCSCCCWVNEALTLSDRVFACLECGSVQDRDANAAKNLAALASRGVEYRTFCGK